MMHLELPLTLSPFGWASLEARAGADGFDLDQVIEQACAHYASELGTGRLATQVPMFGPAQPKGRVRIVSLELDQACAELLGDEARRRGVSPERVVRHATLLYLADLDAGRIADRVAERVQGSENGPVG